MENNNMQPKIEQGNPAPENVKNVKMKWILPLLTEICISDTKTGDGAKLDGTGPTMS